MENPYSNMDGVQSMVGRQGENDAVTMRKKQICKDEICPNVAINVREREPESKDQTSFSHFLREEKGL